MALVRVFQKLDSERSQLHDEVEARYATFERDGRVLFQLNTYGRIDRENPGKVFQSIKLERDGAAQLIKILQSAFRLT